ncbi:MAG: thioredoxin family protein [Tepidanaerobacteraceae bacterium]|jgi:thioredoxin 1|nr:thioredoxin family protein [Thermoanaerobacterales bacterium]
MKDKKGLAIKIIIPVLFLIVVVGIWAIKNSQKNLNSGDVVQSDFALHVTDKLDIDKLKLYGIPIVLNFSADYCIYCQRMEPILTELNAELQGKAIIKIIDLGKNPSLAEDYQISVLPTQIFFDENGEPFEPSDPEAIPMKLNFIRDSREHVFTIHEGALTKDQLLWALKEMGME